MSPLVVVPDSSIGIIKQGDDGTPLRYVSMPTYEAGLSRWQSVVHCIRSMTHHGDSSVGCRGGRD